MAVKVKLGNLSKLQIGLLKVAAVCIGLVLLVGGSVFGFYWFKYKSIVDQRLTQPLFENTAKIYAAPREVRPGQKLTVSSVAQELRDAGYSEDGVGQPSPMGHFSGSGSSISIHPGPSLIIPKTARRSPSPTEWSPRSPATAMST